MHSPWFDDQPDTESVDRIYFECSGAPARPRPLRRLVNFSKAAIMHAMSGMPTCSEQQIDERYAICRACEIFQVDLENPEIGVGTHRDCGCPVTRKGKSV